jgi:hypothetical protein
LKKGRTFRKVPRWIRWRTRARRRRGRRRAGWRRRGRRVWRRARHCLADDRGRRTRRRRRRRGNEPYFFEILKLAAQVAPAIRVHLCHAGRDAANLHDDHGKRALLLLKPLLLGVGHRAAVERRRGRGRRVGWRRRGPQPATGDVLCRLCASVHVPGKVGLCTHPSMPRQGSLE